jgi:hypothetical protein
MFKLLDAYTLRARLVPAVIAAAPALAAIALLISWNKIALSNMIATGALLVLLFALADFARRQGKRIEPILYREMGGKPSTTMMRYADNTFDAAAKEQYRNFLSGKIKSPVPTEAEEKVNPQQADAFYERCGAWLRENTRDTKKFSILFSELVTYGFRRNLLGSKWPALILNLTVVALCFGLLWQRWPLGMEDDLTTRIVVVLVVAAIHALYIAFVVTKASLKEAARTYARQLILSCETFLAAEKPTTARTRAAKKASS